MGKNLKFVINGNSFEAGISKVDRDKVYGFVEEVVTDRDGNICTTGNLLDDGQTIVLSGATSLKTVDDSFAELDKKALKTVYMDGTDAKLIPSSYDGDIDLQVAEMDDLFNLEVTAVYQCTWEDTSVKSSMLELLKDGSLFRFVFNYRADYEGADAILLGSQEEVFVLTGRILEFEYLSNEVMLPFEEPAEVTAEDDGSMDFGML